MSDKHFRSVASMFIHRVQSTPDAEAFYYPDANDEWQTLTWKDVGVRVQSIASGLRVLGLNIEDRSAILCSTRIEWVLIDLGINTSGGATTTIYPTSTAVDCAFIINDSGTRFLFAEDEEQVEKILSVKEQLTKLEKIILIEGRSKGNADVITLKDLEDLGTKKNQEDPEAYIKRIESITPQHLATLIYTSGTTGRPKGVELIQDCWIFEAEAMCNLGFLSPADKQFLWLPLSHVFGKVLEVFRGI